MGFLGGGSSEGFFWGSLPRFLHDFQVFPRCFSQAFAPPRYLVQDEVAAGAGGDLHQLAKALRRLLSQQLPALGVQLLRLRPPRLREFRNLGMGTGGGKEHRELWGGLRFLLFPSVPCCYPTPSIPLFPIHTIPIPIPILNSCFPSVTLSWCRTEIPSHDPVIPWIPSFSSFPLSHGSHHSHRSHQPHRC